MRESRWLPDEVIEQLKDSMIDLSEFDELLTERGWTFDDDESDDEAAIWFYEPSGADVGDDTRAPVTAIMLLAAEDGEVVHFMLVGELVARGVSPAEFVAQLDVIEAYRFGEPLPEF